MSTFAEHVHKHLAYPQTNTAGNDRSRAQQILLKDKDVFTISDRLHSTVRLEIEPRACVTIYDCQTNKYQSTAVTDLVVKDNATVYYCYTPQWGILFSTINVYAYKSSSFVCMPILTDPEFVQLSLNIFLQKAGAQAEVAGHYRLNGKQQAALTVTQHHKAHNTESKLSVNGALFGHARTVYHGTIIIDEGARGSVAEQYNKTVLMSEHARAVSVPNLEIQEHEVQCKHGSAVGTLDSAQLLYMQARGIALEQAQEIILKSFLHEPIQRVRLTRSF